MSIELKIPMDALQDEHVAECLATLFLALGRRPRPGFEQRPSPRPPQRDDAAQAPRVVPRTSAKPAPPPAPEPDVTWEEVMATLTPQTLKFLELVREKRQVTMSQAIKALGLTNPKALGGLTGALSRKASMSPSALVIRNRLSSHSSCTLGALEDRASSASTKGGSGSRSNVYPGRSRVYLRLTSHRTTWIQRVGRSC